MVDDSTVDIATTPSAYIMSHGKFFETNYPTKNSQIFTMTSLPQDLLIDLIYTHLGQSSSCETKELGDSIQLVDVEANKTLFQCSGLSSTSSLLYRINTEYAPSLLLRFIKNETPLEGFVLRYVGEYPT